MKFKARIHCDQSYPVFNIYIPDGPVFWLFIASKSNIVDAREYCAANGLTDVEVS